MTSHSSSDSVSPAAKERIPWRVWSTCIWLLIGGCIYGVAVVLPGSLLPLRLADGGVESDSVKMIILSTIGGILNMTVCPAIGVISDWHRGRFGRRIPFIFASMPPMALALLLMAFIPECSGWLRSICAPFTQMAPASAVALASGIAMLLFQFFFMWIGTVIWYLLGDVVPAAHYGRVTAAFQLGMTAISVIYNRWVFPLAKEHMRTIFICGAIIYAIGITVFCLFVKEQSMPRETERPAKNPFWSRTVNFFKECFCHRIYIFRYLTTILTSVGGCSAIFSIYYYTNLFGGDANVNPLEYIGKLNSYSGLFTTIGIAVISVLAAGIINRWHPLRTASYIMIFSLCNIPLCFRWLFGTLPPDMLLYILLGASLATLPISGLNSVNSIPLELSIFPKSRFGSFCSMQAMVRSIATTVCGLMCGALFDLMRPLFPEGGFHYRMVPVWNVPWTFLNVIAVFLLVREWHKLGGDKSYDNPAPWEPSGFEPHDKFDVSISTPFLRKALLCTGSIAFLAATIAVPFCALHSGYPIYSIQVILPTALIIAADLLWIHTFIRLRQGAKFCDLLATILILCHTISKGIHLGSTVASSGSFAFSTITLAAIGILLMGIVFKILMYLENCSSEKQEPDSVKLVNCGDSSRSL